MSSPSVVVCHEVFDENSQPSAEEICEYAQQLGIDPESESHLLPLARDGLMQALPTPWKAYFDEKLQTHYYYNEDTKKTQWEHPLDNVYRDLVKKARDASMQDDTCASVQELLTSEENTKNLERVETKVESDEELSTDSENHAADVRENPTNMLPKRLTPLGRPPLAPIARLDKKLGDLRVSPLRRSVDGALSKPSLLRNPSDRELLSRPVLERPKMLFKQQSEIIDLKMHVLNSPEDENFKPLFPSGRIEKGFPLTGKGSMFLKLSKSDLPSPDADKSLTVDSMTKSDPPKGILREKITDILSKKTEHVLISRPKQAASFEEDKKSVRFKLENFPEPTVSPGSNSSSEQNDGQSSIISAAPAPPSLSSPLVTAASQLPLNPSIVLSPLVTRPPLPPRPSDSPREVKSLSGSEKDSFESDSRDRVVSPRRRVVRPPAVDYIKSDLFQKNFQKISDLVRPGDIETTSVHLEEPVVSDKEARPRSPMIPQKNKISINLMESIESETSIDSPDREFANLDLNDLDDSNHTQDTPKEIGLEKDDQKVAEISVDKEKSTDSISKTTKSAENTPISEIKVPKLELMKSTTIHSDSEDSRKLSLKDESSKVSKSSLDIVNIRSPQLKISPTPSLGSELRSPRLDFGRSWSPLSTFKPLNKAVIAPQIKTSDSASGLGRSLASPRLDGVILSQGKSSTDNVVVVYQFENQEENFPKPLKSPMIPDMGTRDFIERNKTDEKRRLELSLQKELESIRVEWAAKERKMRAELDEELRVAEEKFMTEKRVRLRELEERHRKELEESLATFEREHRQSIENAKLELDQKSRCETESAEKQHLDSMARLRNDFSVKLHELRQQLELENDCALTELREQLQASLTRDRTRMIEENRFTLDSLREEHITRVTDLRNDYRAEVERLRAQHAWHLEELRSRHMGERAAATRDQRALNDKYRCLKEKYARLKHDVKMSIERRNKRREMSMTTGSETERSNSHKANNQSLERCKELNEVSTSAIVEPESNRIRSNNNPSVRYNDNETSHSESHVANKSHDNNNEADWKRTIDNCLPPADTCQPSGSKNQRHRKSAVAFRESPVRRRDRDRDTGNFTTCLSPTNGRDGTTTDYQDSSDATTADEKPKESANGPGRRRCFTRLKSASTSRLNYSPKRGEGWSSPLESLRQQLRKLDDLEDQFPDLACQPAYSLRYPFAELVVPGSVADPSGAVGVPGAESPELEFVRHRALVEREGMRRARALLKRRRAALRETNASLSPHRAPSEEREATELEVALHRARALLGEKEIRLRHIERALRRLTDSHQPPLIQEVTTSDVSSGSGEARGGEGGAGAGGGVMLQGGGAVLRSLRALHADVRDIWRALDARRPHTASPETSSYNAPTTSQTRLTLSAPEPVTQDHSDGGVAERARGLRAWLQTAP